MRNIKFHIICFTHKFIVKNPSAKPLKAASRISLITQT